MLKRLLCLVLLISCAASCFAGSYGEVSTHKISDGIYLFTTTPYADAGFCGNVVAVVSSNGVLVFDSGAVPDTARRILAELRKLTNQPVRYLVNSHWHWDHWGGNEVFAEAFPGLQIITYEKNREMMETVEPRWNDRGLHQDLPRFLDDSEKRLATARASHIPENKIRIEEEKLEVERHFLNEKLHLKKTLPNLVFSDELMLHMGEREVRVGHARAITPGDTYIFLPREKILITGDILLDPYPFAIGGTYPSEWLSALKSFASLQPAWVIPGHGKPQQGDTLLQNTIELFATVLGQVQRERADGMSADATVAAVGNRAKELRGIVDRATSGPEEFRAYFLDVFTRRAFRQLEGALGDLPDGLQ